MPTAELVDAVAAQWSALAAAVDGLPDDAFGAAGALPGWTVGDLVARATSSVHALTESLRTDASTPDASTPDASATDASATSASATSASPSTEPAGRPTSAIEWLVALSQAGTWATEPGPASSGSTAGTGAPGGAGGPAGVGGAAGVGESTAGVEDPRVVRERFTTAVSAARAALAGLARPDESLRAAAVVAVVHGLDLGVEPERPALRLATRLVARLFAARVPGHAVELRVPPFAAVQIVAGPRHTRGTPPNVVEAGPVPFLLVCTGRLRFAAAVADGRITASGERCDLTPHLPLL
ncbi:sterol carrier family protein [Frankia sp. AgPm24]|uniref:sterol carrier family protein n=1 Tax=Frankia sp. AgPm24 TaxID=631128 RepID=UPI00200CC504|nr:sterol carrier family protein [Frankia sp. AgPm24]MCK9921665.1 sterol carrier family protein [Frankia sp. AgPm24]